MPLTPSQRAQRRQGIGASEVAAILGLDTYRTPLAVYLDKIGELPESPETPEQRMGHALEPVIADLYAEAHPDVVLCEAPTLAHPDHPHFLATPDRLARTPAEAQAAGALLVPALPLSGYPVEIKTRRWSTASAFGVPGTDQVPQAIALQAHWQLVVVGGPHVDVALLIDGREYREYRVMRDAAIAAHLMTAVDQWWRRHVVPRIPPALDGSETTAAWLARRAPQTVDLLRTAGPEEEGLLTLLAEARAQREQWEAREAVVVNALKAAIGDHAGIEGAAGRVTWRQGKPRQETDWQAVAEAAGATPAMIAAYTTTKPGTRPFRPTLQPVALATEVLA